MDNIVSKIRAGQLTFDEAVKAFSQDEATKLNNGNMMNQNTGETTFPISMLDRDMYYAVGGLQQGQVSDTKLKPWPNRNSRKRNSASGLVKNPKTYS